MATTLKQYFPILKERETLLAKIQSKSELRELFEEWTEEQQREFLDFCTGVYTERLEEFLSLILGKMVKILEILPNDSTRIADEMTLLIMDIVVQLEDGTIVNLEVQKIGYKFPGERCACYSADLLLRQYKRAKGRKKTKFDNKLEAWLAFLCMDDPGVIIRLIEQYPEFRAMYEEVYEMCQNIDEVMKMFSKELLELDRNTVQLMIDEMQDEINVQKNQLEEQRKQLEQQEYDRKREVEKRMQMLRKVYAKLQDIEETAQ